MRKRLLYLLYWLGSCKACRERVPEDFYCTKCGRVCDSEFD